MEIMDMESRIDRRIRIIDELLAKKAAERDQAQVQANAQYGHNQAPVVTDGADLPTAPNNYDVIGTWPFPHRP